MRSSSPTPGCFSFFRKSSKAEPQWRKEAPAPAVATPAALPAEPRQLEKYEHFELCGCSQFGSLSTPDGDLPPYVDHESFSDDIRDTIRTTIQDYADKLTEISLYISDHPERSFQEKKAAAKLTAFLEDEGFEVEKGYKDLETAFKATYTHGKGGRTFAYNSEYDALPGVGHACGHNLIAIAGVAAILGVRAALKKHNMDGTVLLIGTPAEEGGVGKGILLERGGYKGVDGCMMIHPVGMPDGKGGVAGVVPTLAIQTVNVDFYGRTSHAGAAPWDGINALDAANIAYTSISAMRQQMHPTDRIHGIIIKGGDAPNIIPDHTSMRYYIRATSAKGVEELLQKASNAFEGAAKATGCKVKITTERMMYDLKNNLQMANEFATVMNEDFNLPTLIALEDFSMAGGSTDFGNVTYEMPACHPHYAIPSTVGRSNHTPEFRDACRSTEAHDLTRKFATGMACVGARFIKDEKFAEEAKQWWKEDMKKTK